MGPLIIIRLWNLVYSLFIGYFLHVHFIAATLTHFSLLLECDFMSADTTHRWITVLIQTADQWLKAALCSPPPVSPAPLSLSCKLLRQVTHANLSDNLTAFQTAAWRLWAHKEHLCLLYLCKEMILILYSQKYKRNLGSSCILHSSEYFLQFVALKCPCRVCKIIDGVVIFSKIFIFVAFSSCFWQSRVFIFFILICTHADFSIVLMSTSKLQT